MADQKIGMMDGAYFVGRADILNWLNDTLNLNLSKIEQTCTGAVACQVLDCLYPGKVLMSKVNWEAKNDYQFVENYKVLQSAFNKMNITRHIEVEKLCRGKYQDNLEFMQWFKRFFDLNYGGHDYDAVAVRMKGKGGKSFFPASGAAKASAPAKKTRATANTKTAPNARASKKENTRANTKPAGAASKAENAKANAELEEMNSQLRCTLDGLEKERDFYFGKLRQIEILCQAEEEKSSFSESIFKILYATDDDFVDQDEVAQVNEGDENSSEVDTKSVSVDIVTSA